MEQPQSIWCHFHMNLVCALTGDNWERERQQRVLWPIIVSVCVFVASKQLTSNTFSCTHTWTQDKHHWLIIPLQYEYFFFLSFIISFYLTLKVLKNVFPLNLDLYCWSLSHSCFQYPFKHVRQKFAFFQFSLSKPWTLEQLEWIHPWSVLVLPLYQLHGLLCTWHI